MVYSGLSLGITANLFFPKMPTSPSPPAAPPIFRLHTKHLASMVHPGNSSKTFQVSRGKRTSSSDVMMVDPLEAKRLAVLQMQEIQAKERLKRQRQIEAINGAWAMIGLTAGLLIEGQTGNSILTQLAGYWTAITSLFR